MMRPSLTVILPSPRFRPHRLDSIEEERDDYHVNLGAETPSSIMEHDLVPNQSLMSRSGIAANTAVPPRTRSWRSLPLRPKTPTRSASREWLDRDCGIWYVSITILSSTLAHSRSFEMAVVPCRTLCCGKLFCLEHLAEVRGPSPGAYSFRLIVTLLVVAWFCFRRPMPNMQYALYP